MKHILLTLLLLSPLAFAEDEWWNFDLGVEKNLYDNLLNKSEEERKNNFHMEADIFQGLFCRSNFNFNKAERNMNKCYQDAFESVIEPTQKILNLNLPNNTGIKVYDLKLDHLKPSIAANLIIIQASAMTATCVPENLGKSNPNNLPFIEGCAESFKSDLPILLLNANRYSRVVYLKNRGLLVDNEELSLLDRDSVLDSTQANISELHSYLEKEFLEVYCRSGLGINIINIDECNDDAKAWLDDVLQGVSQDIKNFNLKYMDHDMVKAFAIQYLTLTINKCAPFTMYLNEFFDIKEISDEERKLLQSNVPRCAEVTLIGYESVIQEAELILKREAAWKKEQEELEKRKIAQAKLQREQKALRDAAKREVQQNKETIGGIFGRIFVASLTVAAEGYIKEKIAKELDIKTGVYHSQDMKYCYYSTPNGIKKVKKKGGRSKTVNLGNVGTNKQVVQYQKSMPGISTRETIYSFADSSAVSTTRTKIYKCSSRL